jgi:transcription elongation factor Elf1
MKRILLFASLLVCGNSFAQTVTKVTDPVDYVNPLMGTASKPDLSTLVLLYHGA